MNQTAFICLQCGCHALLKHCICVRLEICCYAKQRMQLVPCYFFFLFDKGMVAVYISNMNKLTGGGGGGGKIIEIREGRNFPGSKCFSP